MPSEGLSIEGIEDISEENVFDLSKHGLIWRIKQEIYQLNAF